MMRFRPRICALALMLLVPLRSFGSEIAQRQVESIDHVLSLLPLPVRTIFETKDAPEIRTANETLQGSTLRAFFQHPASRIIIPQIEILSHTRLVFAIGLADEGWQQGSDGVGFHVSVIRGEETVPIFDRVLDPAKRLADRGWQRAEVSLDRFAGSSVALVFETDGGPAGHREYDWAYWGEPHLVATEVQLVRSPRPNILLVSFDTLRSDFVGVYGYASNTSPTIDYLARRGAMFEHVLAPAPWTLPSHFSMLTGLDPDENLLTYNSSPCTISSDVLMLAEVLADNQYHTAAFTGGGYVSAALGFGQGFHTFESHGRRFEDNLPDIKEWLDRNGRSRFFLFIHHFNSHRPYEPPDRHLQSLLAHVPVACRGIHFDETDGADGSRHRCLIGPGGIEYLRAVYAAELVYADALLQQLIEHLIGLEVFENTLVVVTSDHGEELMDHGRLDHVRTLFDEVIRVPWVVTGPRVKPGRRISGLAQLSDVTPTILGLVGLTRGESRRDGKDLSNLLVGNAPGRIEREAAFAATRLDRSVRALSGEPHGFKAVVIRGDSKLIRVAEGSAEEQRVFDLINDPKELRPRVPTSSETDRRLVELLEAWIGTRRRDSYCETQSLDPVTRGQLEALGYLH